MSSTNFVDIKTVSGSVILRKKSSKACFFHAPRKGGKGNQEVFLDKASKNNITGGQDGVIHTKGFAQHSPSIAGMKPEISGRRIEQTYQIAEGEILKLFINVRNGYGKLPKTASVFVRVRKKAAYRKLRFAMVDHPDNSFTHAEIEGCFDIISTEDALASGVKIPPAYRMFSDPDTIDSVLSENIVIHEELEAPTITERKILKDEEGNEKTIITKKRRRQIG